MIIGVIIKAILFFLVLLIIVAYYTFAERKVAGYIQRRPGPNRAGPFGLLQPIADGIKLMWKEDIVPKNADKFLYIVSPGLGLIFAMLMYAVIPFGGKINLPYVGEVDLSVAPSVNIALIYVIAVGALGTYTILLSGWASNNRYSLMATVRAAAQSISYEVALGLVVISIGISAGSFDLSEIVKEQEGGMWFFWRQPVAFLLYLIAIYVETNRIPFDLAEAEAELVGGFHTEYGSMKWMLFFVGEYMNMVSLSALMSILFFGGWDFFGIVPFAKDSFLYGLWNFAVFSMKTLFFMFLYMWVRWTLPRFRYDQVMKIGWKVLIPLGLFNIFITSIANVLY
jgi:NADH-quinone oxidoreductase subunit H